jgi:hypothetical protein
VLHKLPRNKPKIGGLGLAMWAMFRPNLNATKYGLSIKLA